MTARSFARRALQLGLIVCATPGPSISQSSSAGSAFPVKPRPLPEAEEIALAESAAPDEISSKADIYALHGTGFVKVRTGTNGCACLVSRDLHEGSSYPMCFDREGVRTSMQREMRETSLRAGGMAEPNVVRAIDAAYAKGELHAPTKASITYMMSPRQVLFSSPFADGVRVGAWFPHVMITMLGVTPAQIGLARNSKVDVISMDSEHERFPELIVRVPNWSDGTQASTKRP